MNKRARFASFALLLAVLLPVYFLVASLGARLGWWSPMTGFAKMTIGPAPWLLGIVAALALAALVATLFRAPRKGWLAAVAALAVPVAVFAGLGALRSQAESVPPIHDIATDIADPPMFSGAMLKARDEYEANPVRPFDVKLGKYDEWKDIPPMAGLTRAEVIANSYPDLESLRSDATPELALLAVEAAMENRDFKNISIDKDVGRAEGTAVVFWYGFHDDVTARVRPDGKGSVIDFRSVSRNGLSDLGVNADRIRDLHRGVGDLLADEVLRAELQESDEDEKSGNDEGEAPGETAERESE